MRAAIEATAAGHVEMMRKCKPGMREAQLMGWFNFFGRLHYNCAFSAYPAIVASGPNAATLHYEANNRMIGARELVLCDCAYRVKTK
jgi:Xaa-Pro aminopeptidase